MTKEELQLQANNIDLHLLSTTSYKITQSS